MKTPKNIKIIKQTNQTKQENQQTILPLTTSISNFIIKLTQSHPNNSSLIKSSIRYLSLVFIRELAVLEELFIQSPIYRLIKYITPSILLPKSSSYPFLLTITLGLIQLKKTWNNQPTLLLNLFISLGPVIHTLHALETFDLQHQIHNSSSSFTPSEPNHPLKRWSIYWLIYCALINLESCNVRVIKDQSQSTTLLRSRPTIYPSIPQNNHADHSRSYFNFTSDVADLFKFFSFSHLKRSPFNLNILKSKNSSKFSHPGTSKAPRIPIEMFDIQAPPLTNLNQNFRRITLPQYLFGRDERVYYLIKFIFLKWCSSEDGRILEIIWASFLAPIASLVARIGSPNPLQNPSRPSQIRVVKVTVSSEEEENGEPDHNRSDSNLDISHYDHWRSVSGKAHQTTDGNSKEERNETSSNFPSPMRRVRSDPGGRSSSLPSKNGGLEIPEEDSHEESDIHARNIRSIRSSYSQTGSSLRSTNLSTSLDLPSHHDHLPLLSSPKDFLKNSSNAFSVHHPLTPFKTPENAWDSLSYKG